MSAKAANAYDTVRYAGYPFPQTHPDRLATLATLFGLRPAPVTECRVLELGCGDGGNLIPMAFGLSGSGFVGVDLSGSAIELGRSFVEELGLSNIELRCADILRLDANLGQFDYVIAHGVYSWTPAEVRDQILSLARALLAPHGVAYVSYNVYPGYYLRQMAREMMLFHAGHITEPLQMVEQGISLLNLLLRKFPNEEAARSDLYGALLKEQLDHLAEYRHRESVYHDDLAEVNEPVYFHQFAVHTAQHGLQYLAEADYFEMQDYVYPPPVRELLKQFSAEQIVAKEQYLDFLKGRVFRQTLLCHQEAPVNRQPNARQMTEFYFASLARPVSSQPELRAGVVEEFRGPRGAKLQTDHPLAKAALCQLSEAWPRALGWVELLSATRARLNGIDANASADDEVTLAEILLAACGSGLVHLHLHAPQFVTEVSARPQTSRLARLQAERGRTITNMLHKNVEVDDSLGLVLLRLLDGTRDRAALCNEMTTIVAHSGTLMREDGTTIEDNQALRNAVISAVEANLQEMARMALLIR